MNLLGLFAALSGAVAVLAGAFGAHWADERAAMLFRTGSQYQLAHALAALLAIQLGARGPAWLFVAGSALFAGSLYALAEGAPGRVFGPVTPLGGLLMIVGWLWLAGALARG
ncbi:DUF423 domain-containing protein [Sphingomonas sp.]|uniref:DUF423 domain-containing protein n=1 Tax=Sphingomonas sp. TaxID=28214 RepID=UPI003CC6759A